MTKVSIVTSFIFGVGIGVVSTMKYFKDKYEAISADEINSIREFYSNKTVSSCENDTPKDESKQKKTSSKRTSQPSTN